MAQGQKKLCFVITPIGESDSDTRRATDGLVDAIVQPVVNALGLDVEVAHKIDEPGSLTNQIVERLIHADLVIANLTNLNPNVMYELAIRHASGRPVVLIAEQGTKPPFDVLAERTLFFVNDFAGSGVLRDRLQTACTAALKNDDSDNPISRANREYLLRTSKDLPDVQKFILDALQRLEGGLATVRATQLAHPGNALKHYVLLAYGDGPYMGRFERFPFLRSVTSFLKRGPRTIKGPWRIDFIATAEEGRSFAAAREWTPELEREIQAAFDAEPTEEQGQ